MPDTGPSGIPGAALTSLARLGAALLGTRWIVRLPIWLYRAGLGWLFGQRFLMLEHVGRSTGRRRFVVLEVIARQNRKRYVVMSGRGPRAQWLRNVRADPHVRIDIGARRGVPAVARELDRTETDVTLDLYARDHPRAWPMIRAVLIRTSGVDVGIAQQHSRSWSSGSTDRTCSAAAGVGGPTALG